MSRIGKKAIPVPDKVKVSLKDGVFVAEGPLGKENVPVNALTEVKIDKNVVRVLRNGESREMRSVHGLSRALLANAINGVNAGFKKNLEIVGVGYRAEVKGKLLKLNLGFSHIVDFPIPESIKIAVKDQTNLEITGSNRELVGRCAAEIRKIRPPEPYKGKGVKYVGEHIIRKVGKAAAGATGSAGATGGK